MLSLRSQMFLNNDLVRRNLEARFKGMLVCRNVVVFALTRLQIVDGLSSYKQPIFVYIIPNGELVSLSLLFSCSWSHIAIAWRRMGRAGSFHQL